MMTGHSRRKPYGRTSVSASGRVSAGTDINSVRSVAFIYTGQGPRRSRYHRQLTRLWVISLRSERLANICADPTWRGIGAGLVSRFRSSPTPCSTLDAHLGIAMALATL